MKKKILIIGILLLVIILGVTYAWWNWTSNNTNVTFNIEGATVTYNGGPNISGIKLIPVSSKEKGVTDNTAAYKEITASSNSTMYLTLNLTFTTFPSQLADQSLVWEIYKGNTKIGNGNFANKSQGDSITLFTNQEINSTQSLYKLYIWIDGNQNNPSTMMNQNFVFTLNATATDEEPVINKMIQQPLNIDEYDNVNLLYEYDENQNKYYYNILGKYINVDILNNINKLYTVNSKTVPVNAIDSWDVSETQNESIMAWYVNDTEDNTKYNLYIGEDGGVYANPNCKYLFSYVLFTNLTEIDLSNFNTLYVTDMKGMFDDLNYLTSLNLGANFDTSNVTDMSYMFSGLGRLTSLNLGNNFDTSNVTDMSSMFYDMYLLESLNLGSNFDTSNVTDMSSMFFNMSSLESLNLGNNFDTSNVTDMSYMFGCSDDYTILITSLNLGNNFDTSNVTNMRSMFSGLGHLTSLNLGNNFDTSNVTDMSMMFSDMYSLTSLNLGNNFDTSNVTDMSYMFRNNSALVTIYAPSDFDTSNVANSYNMFYNCTNLVGGNNTHYNSSYVGIDYTKIDRNGVPGYFTDISVLNN